MPSLNNRIYKFPVSIKGILICNEKIILLKNERDEWELPGGKLELNENPIDCLVREIFEEVGIKVKVKDIVDSWVYEILEDIHVLIITYCCYELEKDVYRISDEHSEGRWFSIEEIEDLKMPQGYKASIKKWYNSYK